MTEASHLLMCWHVVTYVIIDLCNLIFFFQVVQGREGRQWSGQDFCSSFTLLGKHTKLSTLLLEGVQRALKRFESLNGSSKELKQ